MYRWLVMTKDLEEILEEFESTKIDSPTYPEFGKMDYTDRPKPIEHPLDNDELGTIKPSIWNMISSWIHKNGVLAILVPIFLFWAGYVLDKTTDVPMLEYKVSKIDEKIIEIQNVLSRLKEQQVNAETLEHFENRLNNVENSFNNSNRIFEELNEIHKQINQIEQKVSSTNSNK